MSFPVPSSFSPSSLSQFTSCPLAFRFSYVERRPSQPQPAATKGTIVHRALEHLFHRDPLTRTRDNGHFDLDLAFEEYSQISDLTDLQLSESELTIMKSQAHVLMDKYFEMEDPTHIHPIGLELKLEAKVGDTTIRGIIDRLELDNNGDLVVTDYKTGSVPRATSEQSRMGGVHIYALLCEKVFGKLPARVQLLYLSQPTTIISIPTAGTVKGVQVKSSAVHRAVVSACESGDFRPNPSALCSWCSYQDLCPAQGGILPHD
ncbi:MAG TPA: PD-(D/E)XK nuclease family protein [Acidimicrobiia bacterium]|nr:PD-(D/E)XK nuclease family protein [Acidimicrobiia bacterium]